MKAVEKKYKHKCDFCTRRFKTQSNMMKHRSQCVYNYDTTEEIFEIEKIVNVFGFADSRWFLVKWVGYDVPDWQPEHLLLRDVQTLKSSCCCHSLTATGPPSFGRA